MQDDLNILEHCTTVDALAKAVRRSKRWVTRAMNEPDGIGYVQHGRERLPIIESAREYFKRREHKPNPRRGAK